MNGSQPISRTSRILAAILCGSLALGGARFFFSNDASTARAQIGSRAGFGLTLGTTPFAKRSALGFDDARAFSYLDGNGARVDSSRLSAEPERLFDAAAPESALVDASSVSATGERFGAADFADGVESDLARLDESLRATSARGAEFDDSSDETTAEPEDDLQREVAWADEVRIRPVSTPDFNDAAAQPDWRDQIELNASAYEVAFDDATPELLAPALAKRVEADKYRFGSKVFVADSNAQDAAGVDGETASEIAVARPVESSRGTNRPIFVEAQRVGAFVAPGAFQTATLPAQTDRRYR